MKKTLLTLMLVSMLALAGCRKENMPEGAGKMAAIQLDAAFNYSMDSSCIMIPNLFTPNGDGINDRLHTNGLSIASFQLMIYNAANQLVFNSTALNVQWNGYQNTPSGSGIFNGKYHYDLTATTQSSQNIAAQRYIYIVTHPSTDCLAPSPPAFFGDMTDPRYCGAVYTTQETVCYQ